MRLIDDLARNFPGLDLLALQILLQIDETPGFSIRELAEILQIDPKTAQLKITLLGGGRRNRNSSAYRLVDDGRSLADKRKRSLATTPDGAEIAGKLQILTAVLPQ